MARQRALITIAGGALALWFALPHFVNYDAAWSLVWGGQIFHGGGPRLDAPFAPTPHPLTTLVGVALAPLGSGAGAVLIVLGCVSLATLGWLAFALASAWFGRPAGWAAAALVLTSGPLLWFGARAYLDVPYVALVLGSLLVETRRRRAGAPALGLLSAAGLLRPEAWIFAGLYTAYAARGRDRRHALGLLALAASAPVSWLLCDLALTGDPLHSLTWTREAAATLGRPRGPGAVLTAIPDKLAATAGVTVLAGGAAGLAASLARPRRAGRLPASALGATIAAGAALAAAGMPVAMRYQLLCLALLAILCAGGAVGWLALPPSDPRRRLWSVVGAAVLGLLVLALPARLGEVMHRHEQLSAQASVRADLRRLAGTALPRRCGPVTVASHKLVPLLALWTGRPAAEFRSGPGSASRLGLSVQAAAPAARGFLVASSEGGEVSGGAPAGGIERSRSRAWRVVGTCAGGQQMEMDRAPSVEARSSGADVAGGSGRMTRCACR